MKENENENPKNINNSPDSVINEPNKKRFMTQPVGTFDGFLIYDKISKGDNNNLNIPINEFKEPLLKDWLVMQHNPKKTKSRFSKLFKEILENDKIAEKNNNDNNINNENLTLNKNEDDKYENNEINIINEKMDNLNINNDNDNFIENNDFFQNSINNINDNEIKDNRNINIIINNFQNFNNFNNNNIINPNIYFNQPKMPNNFCDFSFSNSNSFPSDAPTASSSFDKQNNFLNFGSNISGNFFEQKSNNNNNSGNSSKRNSIKNMNNDSNKKKSEKKFDLNIDIKRIIYLEDRRTTLMIKNIPNKFQRDTILKIIDQNFKGLYDLFILPTDAKGYKNFGYSFINFISCYHIPYFFYLFNNKKWPSTNSQKVCEITYSKIQGRHGLLSHYSNKITFKNSEVKKFNVNSKFIIPNEYYDIFISAFPNYNVEKFESYFITNMPFRY